MSGIGAKLSRHVLGMKFMRKTKAQFDKSEKTSSTSGVSTSVKTESTNKEKNDPTVKPPSLIVEELWSYNQCERYIFGRQSFGGFNPSVEKNVRKGIWKPFYLDEGENTIESSDEDEKKKCQSDVDVSDEEMAKTYGSLIGTLAKKFKGNRKDKGKKKDFQNNQKGKGKNKKSKWSKKSPENDHEEDDGDMKRGNNSNKRQRNSTGSSHFQEDRRSYNRPSPSKRHHSRGGNDDDEGSNMPPPKRRKFLKPSD